MEPPCRQFHEERAVFADLPLPCVFLRRRDLCKCFDSGFVDLRGHRSEHSIVLTGVSRLFSMLPAPATVDVNASNAEAPADN